jgi:ubiquinone/menaquinone biosynthesis C-methylase UbiE
MFEKHFTREYEMFQFPHFVPKEELEYNFEFVKNMVEERWIYHCWRENIERGGWVRYEKEAEKITSNGGMILEICAGPGGGFFPATLMKDYSANIMISDLCPTVVREWWKHLQQLVNPPPNVEYAAFNVCNMPFEDNCLDVVSGCAAIINVEGDRDKALKEIFRVLKPGGLFVFDYIFVTEEFFNKMSPHIKKVLKEKYPTIFWDTLNVFDELGFSEIETIEKGTWSNENDESSLADLCRSLNTSLTFSTFLRYCRK